METHMDEDAIRKLGKEIAKSIKTEADLGAFSKLLKKIVVETALDAELTDHLGYDKHTPEGYGSGNNMPHKHAQHLVESYLGGSKYQEPYPHHIAYEGDIFSVSLLLQLGQVMIVSKTTL